MKFIEKSFNYIVLGLLVLILLRGCVLNRKFEKVDRSLIQLDSQIYVLNTKLDSMRNELITEDELNFHLTDNMWNFLELEELSDKNKIPINQLKNERYKKPIVKPVK